MRPIFFLCFIILLTACSAQPVVLSTQTPDSALPAVSTAMNVPATNTFTPVSTETAAPTSTPLPPPRWFWAITKDKILAFNANGQVNTIFDTTGIQQTSNDNPPIRVSDERAVAFFANNDNPKAFVLTSNSALPIDLPKVHAPIPQNGWSVEAQHNPYIVLVPNGTVTTPALLINGETGKASLIATDVFGPTEISYLIYFSPDGQSLRFATGEDPVKIHNRNLQTNADKILFESGSSLAADSSGELWYDYANGAGVTADGAPITFTDADGNTRHLLLNQGWILAVPRDCDSDCPLQAAPATGSDSPLNFVLPIKLVQQVVSVNFGQLLDQNRLLIAVTDNGSTDYNPTLWLLSPDGKSNLLGRSIGIQYQGRSSVSADGRYILVTSADDPSTYKLYDLTTDQVIFSKTSGTPDILLDVTYFTEAALILQADTTNHYWVYNFAAKSAFTIDTTSDNEYCTALTPDGKPICMADDGMAMYDPITGNRTLLIEEPGSNLSN